MLTAGFGVILIGSAGGTLLLSGSGLAPQFMHVSIYTPFIIVLYFVAMLGSNLFNMLILAVDDIVYTKGPLFASVSPPHAVTAFAAFIMSGIFVVAVLYQPATRFRGTVGWVSIALLVIYLLSAYSAYLYGN